MSTPVTLSPEIEKALADLRQAIETQLAFVPAPAPGVGESPAPESTLPPVPDSFTLPTVPSPSEQPASDLPFPDAAIAPAPEATPSLDLPNLTPSDPSPTPDLPAAPPISPDGNSSLPPLDLGVPSNDTLPPLETVPAPAPADPFPLTPPTPETPAPATDDQAGFPKARGLLGNVLNKGWNSKK